MFTRVIEITAKSGKARELCRFITDRELPVLKIQPGFIDQVVLVDDATYDQILAITFWRTKEDADKYARDHFSKMIEGIQNLSETPPIVRTFNVDRPANRSGLGDFSITFDSDISPTQVRSTLHALADYFRACGGVGFDIDFELEDFILSRRAYA